MMPFRPEDIMGQVRKQECKPRTLRVIQRLIKTGRIPMNLISALADEIGALESLD